MHARRESLEPWLRSFIAESGGIAGTVHLVEGDALALAAAVNIPEKVQEVTRVVPRGKGMAGLAWERGQPVQTCNLQTDSSGDVRPGARAVAAQAAVALPVRDAAAGVRAVVGIAFADERELDQKELARLAQGAGALPA
ncbi:MAG TPA: GAF domain-containing protein [Sorangium sp.]|uniref:GAF domain-containing protein n=1 Tax=Sorangium sp. So ce1153 TaxID=3133333 RepID=UPI002BFD8404|nr:GAF domain-containing protein [Sorangium sp.]